MPGKKQAFKNRNALVNEIAKLENTKDQANVNAYRNAFKRLIELDVKSTLAGMRAPLTLLRKESLAIVNKKKAKAKGKP
jgi:hypothetical protein